jgi:hypothetical protein
MLFRLIIRKDIYLELHLLLQFKLCLRNIVVLKEVSMSLIELGLSISLNTYPNHLKTTLLLRDYVNIVLSILGMGYFYWLKVIYHLLDPLLKYNH